MELVLFIGIQATGKSSFYRERFYRTHVRLNLDMLKTRRREELLLKACLEGKATKAVRRRLKVEMELPMKDAYEDFMRERLCLVKEPRGQGCPRS